MYSIYTIYVHLSIHFSVHPYMCILCLYFVWILRMYLGIILYCMLCVLCILCRCTVIYIYIHVLCISICLSVHPCLCALCVYYICMLGMCMCTMYRYYIYHVYVYCIYVHLSVWPSIHLSICLPVCPSIHLSVNMCFV